MRPIQDTIHLELPCLDHHVSVHFNEYLLEILCASWISEIVYIINYKDNNIYIVFIIIEAIYMYFPLHRRRQWQPTPVLLPGKSHGQRSLVTLGR